MSNDVEKRWNDPQEMRRATIYAGSVIIVAAVAATVAVVLGSSQADACRDAAFRICKDPERLLIAIAPPTILLLGGIGAFVNTYRVWKAGGVWPIWQGAGWLLFALMLVYFTMSGSVLAS
ncbi:hypothetical protein [Rhodococcus sovatensis]|uniref:Integral membrane protein n=1 Tax=Rhodococcus sovatensis TaxID=1805840 RepID=A0ABZ2PNC8_9NOCA